MMRKTRLLPMVIGILLILAGVYGLFFPVETSAVIPYIIGIALTITGIGKIFRWTDEKRFYGSSRWSLAGAVISMLFGLMLAISPALQLSMGTSVIVLIACWVMAMGLIRILHAFRLRKMNDYDLFGRPIRSSWYMAFIPGLLMLLIGVMNIVHPEIGLGMIGALIGVIMIFSGSTLLSFGKISWIW